MISTLSERSTSSSRLHYGPKLPRSLAHAKQWLREHHMTLMAINDTPHSIALGSAVGMFFGFTPLTGLKTLLSILFAWISRCNKIAAVIAVTLHDILIFVMPAVYYAEYKIGCWVLRRPRPSHRIRFHFSLHDYVHGEAFTHFVWPALIGSFALGIPAALATYLIMRMLVSRSRSATE